MINRRPFWFDPKMARLTEPYDIKPVFWSISIVMMCFGFCFVSTSFAADRPNHVTAMKRLSDLIHDTHSFGVSLSPELGRISHAASVFGAISLGRRSANGPVRFGSVVCATTVDTFIAMTKFSVLLCVEGIKRLDDLARRAFSVRDVHGNKSSHRFALFTPSTIAGGSVRSPSKSIKWLRLATGSTQFDVHTVSIPRKLRIRT
jgi:hypothetical protein